MERIFMKNYRKYGFLLIILIIILIYAISMVSAVDDSSASDEIKNTNPLEKENGINSIAIKQQTSITDNEEYEDADIQKNLKAQTKYPVIYVSSNASKDDVGDTRDNPTTLTNAIDNLEDGGSIYLITNSTSDKYTLNSSLYFSYKPSFNIIGESGKNITIESTKSELIHLYHSSINVTNINFMNKNSQTSAIYLQDSSMKIDNCTFIKNYRNNYSSCIYVSSSNVTVIGTNFFNNSGVYGNIYSTSNSNITLNYCLFENNTAKLGGAVYARNSYFKINKSKFRYNNASYAGCIYLYNTKLESTNNLFKSNNAEYYGGAIVSLENQTVTIKTTNFTDNNASIAGAIYAMYTPLSVSDSIFDSNNADTAGCVFSFNNTLSIQKSALVSDDVDKSMVLPFATKSCNLDNNWWGVNNPDFKQVTDGFIPDTWILMRLYKGANDTVNVTLNELSNAKKVNTSIQRLVYFRIKENNKTISSFNVKNNVTKKYNCNESQLLVVIDNEVMNLSSKITPLLLSDDIIAKKNSTVLIEIDSNADISGNVSLYINNTKVTVLKAGQHMNYTYTIPSTLKEGIYDIDLVYSGNSKYEKINSTYDLIIQSSTYNKTNIITPTRTYSDITVKLPSYYNLVDLNQTTPVKRQGSSGSCVTFASMAAIESSIKKVTNVTYDFSENNLKNILKRFSVNGYANLLPNDGGYDLEPVGYFVSGLGPVLESMDEYDTESVLSPEYTTQFQVQNVYFIPHRQNYTDNDLIKEAIMKYGGVFTSIKSSSNLNIYTQSSYSNHVVCIVGWNDTYSRSNFSPNPPGDGAFIIKNSWGTTVGNNGYQYVSYYDSVIGDILYQNTYNDINFAVNYNNLYNYSNIYQYDSVCYIYKIDDTSGSYSIKNIYTINENQAISAVGTYFVNTSNYTIKLYINGNLVNTKKGTVDYPGYRTIYLDNFYRVNRYDEVVVTIDITQNMDKNYIYVPLQDSDYPVYSKANISFISYDNQKTWEDLYTNDNDYYTAPIKVYTMDIPMIKTSLKYKDDLLNLTVEVSDLNSSARLYYKLNGEYLYNSNNKIISNSITKSGNVSISNSTVGLSNGNYTLETVLVYNGINITQKNSFKITDKNITINANNITSIINQTQILDVEVVDSHNQTRKINEGIITVSYANKTIIATAKVSNNHVKINLSNTKSGNYTLTVTYSNSTGYNDTYKKILFRVKPVPTTLTVNTNNTYVLNTSLITGKLVDKNNKSVSGAKINIRINGNNYTSKTNGSGEFTYKYKNTIVGKNNVTVTFKTTAYYGQSTKSIVYTTSILPTKISLTKINSTIGEKITLKATVTDKYNNPVNSGYVIFKINSVTVKDNGQINGSNNALKVYVKNGVASTDIIAYLNVRYGQNLTAVYSGSSDYEAVRSGTTKIDIKLRNAQIVVKCNSTKAKQDTVIKFTATIYDVTSGKRSSVIHNLSEQYVYFKVNGITIKNDDGTVYQAKVINGVATYEYRIPKGFMAITDAVSFNPKNHTVTAGLYNKNYYPNVVNYTYFQVERSIVNINVDSAVINNKTHKLSLNGSLKDYKGNNVVSTSKIIIKVNGITLKDSKNRIMYFMIQDGKIQLKDINIPAANKYTSLTIVCHDRLGYQSARATSTKITVKN